jgi:Protein of unknown function (DUF2442)
MRTIKKILEIKEYKLNILFDNSETKWVDLESKLKSKSTTPQSKYLQLLNKDYFKTVKVHPEWETIYWENGLDFCPDSLYTT